MLNNKKNLLQRVQIAMVAIVTIMSVGGALAMKAPSHQAGQTYGYFSTTATGHHYVVTETAASPDHNCDLPNTTICTVVSSVQPTQQPDGSWEVPKSSATINEMGVFSE